MVISSINYLYIKKKKNCKTSRSGNTSQLSEIQGFVNVENLKLLYLHFYNNIVFKTK